MNDDTFPQSKAEQYARAHYSAIALDREGKLTDLDPVSGQGVSIGREVGDNLFHEYMDLGIALRPRQFEWILDVKRRMLCRRLPKLALRHR